MPDSQMEEKYPQNNGRNFCVGILSDKVAEPVWQIEYHPFANYLLSIKSDNLVQVWDCKSLVKKASSYDHGNTEKCKEDFVTLSEPFKEYRHEAGGAPTCCTWLPTDSNMFAIGYSSGQVAFFDYQTGQVQSSVDLESEIISITAHELQP